MTSTRTDVRLANEAWEALMTAHSSLIGLFSSEDIWKDASMREYDLLYTLAKSPEPMRISDIKERVLLSQPALSRMVDRLVDRGLVERRTDCEDGRAVRISLTDDGARTQREIGRAHARSVAREVGSALDTDELRELQRLCRKLASH